MRELPTCSMLGKVAMMTVMAPVHSSAALAGSRQSSHCRAQSTQGTGGVQEAGARF